MLLIYWCDYSFMCLHCLTLNSGMDIPFSLRTSMRSVLLSKTGGIYLDRICEEYQNMVNKPLDFQHLGYQNIEAFIRSIPDAARQDIFVSLVSC